MYKKNSIILNERKYAESVIETGDLGKKVGMSITLVARYYNDSGMSENDIRSNIESLVLRHDPKTSIVKWEDTISRSIRNGMKRNLVEIDFVPITKLELDICGSLKSKQASRVMFTLFCIAKFEHMVNDKNMGWVDLSIPYLFRTANVKRNLRDQAEIINDLYKLGYLNLSANVDSTSMQVVFMDTESVPVLMIDDFRDLGNQYMEYKGVAHFRCAICGSLVRRSSNSQLYCGSCSKPINRKKHRKSNFKG